MKIFPIFKKIIIQPSDEVDYEGLVYSLPEDMPLPTEYEYAIRVGVLTEIFPFPIDENFIIATATEETDQPIPIVEDLIRLSALLAIHPVPVVEDALRIEQDEVQDFPSEFAIAIVKGQEETIHPVPVVEDAIRLEQDEVNPLSVVEDAIRLEQDEIHIVPVVEDAVRLEQDEIQDFPIAEESLTLISQEETVNPLSDVEDAIRLEQDEVHIVPTTNDSVVIDLEQEAQPYPIAAESLTALVVFEETPPPGDDANTAEIIDDLEVNPVPDETDDDLHILYLAGGEAFNGGVGNWTNQNNALGLKDGVNATISSALLGTASGDLTMDFPDLGIETDWEIETVYIRYYFSISTTLNLGANTMLLRYRIGNSGAFTQLDSFTLTLVGTTNHLTDYRAYDISSAINSLADLQALEGNMNASLAGPGVGNSMAADAIELVVTLRKGYGTNGETTIPVTNGEFEDNYPTVPPTGWTVDSGTFAYAAGVEKQAVTGHAVISPTSTTLVNDLRQRIPIGTVGEAGNLIRAEWLQTNLDVAPLNQIGVGFIFRDSGLSEISSSFPQLKTANATIPYYGFRTHTAIVPSGTEHVDLVVRGNPVSDQDGGVEHVKLWNLGGAILIEDAEFSANNMTFNEEDGVVMVTVARAKQGNVVSVQYDVEEVSALIDDNWDGPVTGTLNFGATETSKQFPLTVLNNTIRQGDLIANVKLTNPSAGSIIVDDTGIITIEDNDPVNSGYTTQGIRLNGSTDYYARTSALAGVSDSLQGLFSGWFNVHDHTGGNAIIDIDGLGGNSNFEVFVSQLGTVRCVITNNLNGSFLGFRDSRCLSYKWMGACSHSSKWSVY